MAWTVVPSVSPLTVFTAAWVNAYIRDNLNSFSQVWANYNPAWSGTIGNGTLLGAYYWPGQGKTVLFRIRLIWGTTTSHAVANQTMSLPFACNAGAYSDYAPMGVATCFDVGVMAWQGVGMMAPSSASLMHISAGVSLVGGAQGIVTNVIPMTWGTSDQLYICGSYEAA